MNKIYYSSADEHVGYFKHGAFMNNNSAVTGFYKVDYRQLSYLRFFSFSVEHH